VHQKTNHLNYLYMKVFLSYYRCSIFFFNYLINPYSLEFLLNVENLIIYIYCIHLSLTYKINNIFSILNYRPISEIYKLIFNFLLIKILDMKQQHPNLWNIISTNYYITNLNPISLLGSPVPKTQLVCINYESNTL